MKLAVFGLGYVGCITAVSFVREGHDVIGVDISAEKIKNIQRGISPIVEPGLSESVRNAVESGKLSATYDVACAIQQAEIAIICVGTPSQFDGSVATEYVERVCRDIGQALANKDDYTVVVVRSTVLPGVVSERLIPLLERESEKRAGHDFGFCVNPEFLREGSAMSDFQSPPFTIIGELDPKSGEKLAQLYASFDAPLYRVPLGVAEMIKYSSNAFHALKVVFANEIGNLCQAYGIDSHKVMDVFVKDNQLNLSPYYLKPGFAFGGSCLGKDMRALLYAGRQRSVRLPVLEAILPSNQLQIEKALNILLSEGRRAVALIGISFKSSTDDLRESPAVELAERLLGKGFELHIYDREVSLSHLHGSNQSYIARAIPHISCLIRPTLEEAIALSESIVVTKSLTAEESSILSASLRPDQTLIDLVRLNGQTMQEFAGRYHGICW